MNTTIRICRFFLRCLRRTLVTLLIVIAIAAACLWVRSYWVADDVDHYRYQASLGGRKVDLRQALSIISKHYNDEDDNWFPGGSLWWSELFVSSSRGGVSIDYTDWGPDDVEKGETGGTFFEDMVDDLVYMGAEKPWRHRTMSPAEYHRLGAPAPIVPKIHEFDLSPGYWRIGCDVPYWLVLLLTLPYPLWRARRVWKLHRRHKLGLCIRCGYDLRASSDRCPECGLAFVRHGGPGASDPHVGSAV